MYFLQSLQGHSLDFHYLILFLNLFNELHFFILFGTVSQILVLNTLPTEYHSESSLSKFHHFQDLPLKFPAGTEQ